MVVSLFTYTLRRVTAAAVSRAAGGARAGNTEGSTGFLLSYKVAPVSFVPSAKRVLPSTGAAALAQLHSYGEIRPPAVSRFAKDAPLSNTLSNAAIAGAVFQLSLHMLPIYKGPGAIACGSHPGCACKGEGLLQRSRSTQEADNQWSDGLSRSICGTSVQRYTKKSSTSAACRSCSESYKVTYGHCGRGRRRNAGNWSVTSSTSCEPERRSHTYKNAVTGFRLSRMNVPYAGFPKRRAACGSPSATCCFSSSVSGPSCSPSPSSSSSTCLPSKAEQYAVQQRQACAAIPSRFASAQPHSSGNVTLDEVWIRDKEQTAGSGKSSSIIKRATDFEPQERKQSSEALPWDFAQIQRIPHGGIQSTEVVADRSEAETYKEAHESDIEHSAQTRSAAEKSPVAPEVARKGAPRPASRRKGVQRQILRVTDAAAGRIQEIVHNFNREAGMTDGDYDALLRTEFGNCGSDSSDSSDSSNSSSGERRKGAEARRRAIGIRIGLKKRGCSGLSYTVDVAMASQEKDKEPRRTSLSGAGGGARSEVARHSSSPVAADEVVETKGGTVVLAGDAIMFLVGTELDFVDTELERKFVFRNPNEKQACGCGKSFTV